MTYTGIKMYPPLENTETVPSFRPRVVEMRGILDGRWKDNVIFKQTTRRKFRQPTNRQRFIQYKMKQSSAERNMEPIDLPKYVLDISLKIEKLQVDVLVTLVFRDIG